MADPGITLWGVKYLITKKLVSDWVWTLIKKVSKDNIHTKNLRGVMSCDTPMALIDSPSTVTLFSVEIKNRRVELSFAVFSTYES